MKHTRSLGLFLLFFFLFGQMSLHAVALRATPNETRIETEFQPLIEFKFSLAQLLAFVESFVPNDHQLPSSLSYPTHRIHLVSVLLNSHHISLPPPAIAA